MRCRVWLAGLMYRVAMMSQPKVAGWLAGSRGESFKPPKPFEKLL